ncbi:MAG: hypothetical protein K8R65_01605, partial [Nitrospirae bacterium]|nr:hypothetical protein [Nitrospirota bacterium]
MNARWISRLFDACSRMNAFLPLPRRQRRSTMVLKAVEVLEERCLLTPISWVAQTDGFWDDPNNWSTGQVPNAGDDVTLDLPGFNPIITIRDNRTVKSIVSRESLMITAGTFEIDTASQIDASTVTLTGGALYAFGTVTITNTATLDWQGGSTFGAGLTNAGTITVTGAADKVVGGILTNSGTILDSGTGAILFNGSSKLVNNAGALFNFTGDGDLGASGNGGGFAPFFQNDGTIRKSAGIGVSAVNNLSLNNSATGIFDVQSGRLNIASANNSWTGGTFNGGPGGVLEISGTVAISDNLTGAGNGHLELTGALNTTGAGATVNFPAGYFEWFGGAIGAGAPLTNAGSLTLPSATNVRLGGQLFNNGTILQSGTGSILFDGSTKLINGVGALYDLAGDGDVGASGIGGGFAPFFQNDGTLRKSAGNDVSIVSSIALNGSATAAFDVQSGRLKVSGGSNTWSGGTFSSGSGGVFEISGTVTTSGTLNGTGAGHLELTGNLNTTSDGATLNFSADHFQWLSGSISGAGPGLINAGSMTVTGAADRTIFGKLIDNGIIEDTGTGRVLVNTGSLLIVSDTGVYDFQNDGNWGRSAIGGGGGQAFEVHGILKKTGGTGTSMVGGGADPIPLNLVGGTIDVQSGRLRLIDGGLWQGGELNASNGGVLELAGTSVISATGGFTGSGDGQIELNTSLASSDFGVAGAHATLNFPDGLLHWVSGTIGSGGSGSGVGSATTLVNAGFMTLDGSGTKTLYG